MKKQELLPKAEENDIVVTPLMAAVEQAQKPPQPKQSIDQLEIGEDSQNFQYSMGLSSLQAVEELTKFGRNELPEKKVSKIVIFCSLLIEPMPLMIWAAAIIEAGIENFLDMGILIGIQFANASIGFYEYGPRQPGPERCAIPA